MYQFIVYDSSYEEKWDNFIFTESINGTFLQTRRFLKYHPEERFTDFSVIVLYKNKIVAVCPGCMNEKREFISHMGSTFGGLVLSSKLYRSKYLFPLLEEFEIFLINNLFTGIVLKLTSDIFSNIGTGLFEYCYQYMGYREYIELSTYIDFGAYDKEIVKNFSQGKRTNVSNCIKAGCEYRKITEDKELEKFYELLCTNLSKYGTKPVHTLEELYSLKNKILKNEIEFYGIYLKNQMIAGAMLFLFHNRNAVHTQYLAADMDHSKLSPMTFLCYSIIEDARSREFRIVSWGISTEERGKIINKGLLESKESYGAQYSVNRTYIKNLTI